jgi:heptaprenyl diphosphate synthase
LIASLAHIIGQFVMVRFWIIPHNGIFYLLPIFIVSAFLFGLVTALVTNKLLQLNSKK